MAENVVGSQLPYTRIFSLTSLDEVTPTYFKNKDLKANRNIGKNIFYKPNMTKFSDAWLYNRD
jgi:hypothetical protein